MNLRQGIALAAALLAACGGGGGSGSADPPPAPAIPRLELVAGIPQGGIGNTDGLGSAARFNQPRGIAIDPAGALYVADTQNFTIRRVQPHDGLARTFAGSPTEHGFADGTGTAARFGGMAFLDRAIGGVAIDNEGNVYLADTGNHRIRKVTPSAVVTTLAGSGIAGHVDGPGGTARFDRPHHIAVDAAGDVYVAEFPAGDQQRIRKITRGGEVSTLTSGPPGYRDGPAASALFRSIGGLAIDAAGSLYVSDAANKLIRRLGVDGMVSTVAGQPGVESTIDGSRGQAAFSMPLALTVDRNGIVYVADWEKVRRVTPAGEVSTVAELDPFPMVRGCLGGIAVSAAGELFATDSCRHTVVRMSGAAAATVAGNLAPPGDLVDGPASVARFQYLTALAADGRGGLVAIDNGSVRRVSTQGEVTTVVRGSFGSFGVAGLAVDAEGAAYFATFRYCGLRPNPSCVNESTVRRASPDGMVTEVAPVASSDGSALSFRRIGGLARDAAGTLYLTDQEAHRVLRLDASGNLTTLAGDTLGNADGMGRAARFNTPTGIALDAQGNVYVSDSGNSSLRKITPAGAVTTLFAGFNHQGIRGTPAGVAVDAGSNVYVADSRLHVVWKVSPSGGGAVAVGQPNRQGFIPELLPAFLDTPLALAVTGSDLWISQGSALALVRNRP